MHGLHRGVLAYRRLGVLFSEGLLLVSRPFVCVLLGSFSLIFYGFFLVNLLFESCVGFVACRKDDCASSGWEIIAAS